MKRLLLFALLVLLVLSIRPVRQWVGGHAEPVLAFAQPGVEIVQLRAKRWVASREARSILVGLEKRARGGLDLPTPHSFSQRGTSGGHVGRDPWGSNYYLEITNDSVIVGSPGEDLERGTDRDIRFGMPRW